MPARLLARPNRFLAVVQVGGIFVPAACRDPGRLETVLVPGARVLLAAAGAAKRATRFDVMLARSEKRWISVVPDLANRVFEAALRRGGLSGLEDARVLRREVPRGRSRFDFLLSWRGRELLTEVKSVTFVAHGEALFPDAPTARGARHLRELAELGRGAAVVFVVQREDAQRVRPFVARDPGFAQALADAERAGVRLRAYACRVQPRGIRLQRALPVGTA